MNKLLQAKAILKTAEEDNERAVVLIRQALELVIEDFLPPTVLKPKASIKFEEEVKKLIPKTVSFTYSSAFYDTLIESVAKKLREIRKEALREATELAWKMQSGQFGGGTAIGNAIQEL